MPILVKVNSRIPQIIARLEIGAEAVDRATAESAAEAARVHAPVRTGTLQRSIEVFAGDVEVTAEYARFVEYGTRYMIEQPFLEPAADEVEDSYEIAMRTMLQRL